MKIYYLKNGVKYNSSNSCQDFELKSTSKDGKTTVVLTAKEDIELVQAVDLLPIQTSRKDLYFLNGYQSWTDTKEYKLSDRLRDIRKSPHIISHMYAMHAYGDNHFYKYSINKSHGYDLFYSKGENESFIYNINFNAYLTIELVKNNHKTIRIYSDLEGIVLKKGQVATIFDYYCFLSYEEGLESFKQSFPLQNHEKIFGYTSWYNYYQNINEEIIIRDLKALDNRFNLFQIDDGYETFVGDWLDVDKKKFPNGLKPIVEEIHSRGYRAGIWLAPFVAETKSKLFQEHQDWFARDKKGKILIAGGNWSKHYVLDLSKEEVRDYIQKCLEHYMDLGFDFFKLDFLYAAGLPCFKGTGKTRSMAQRQAYEFLREILKDKLILGCGANLFNSMHIFDYLRIGPDVSLSFNDVAYMRLFHRERPSTKVTLQNTIYRSIFDQRLFANDPDVFLLRDTNIQMSYAQRCALTKINALFGSVLMTSDDIAEYDDTKKEMLQEALNIFEGATDRHFKKSGKFIDISYKLDGKEHSFTYNTEKGVITNER